MKDSQIATAFQSAEVQKIVERSAKRLIRKYDDKNLEFDELVNQAYLSFYTLMKKFKYEGQIMDFNDLPKPALGYVGAYLPLRLEDYVWEICNIKRTKSGYKKNTSVSFDPEYHGGSTNGKFEKELEVNEVIDDALFEITDSQRDLMILEFFEDRTPDEIAAYMKVTPSTYRKRKFDGLVALRRRMAIEKDLLQEVI